MDESGWFEVQGDYVWVTRFTTKYKLNDKKYQQIKSDYLRIARKYETPVLPKFQSDK